MALLIQVNADGMISLDQTHDACVPEQAAHRDRSVLLRLDVREWDGPAVLPPRTAQTMTGA